MEIVSLPANLTEPDKEQVLAIICGKQFQAFYEGEVYKRVCDWFERRANDALREMRGAKHIDNDRTKANLMLAWATTENIFRDFQMFVQDKIQEKDRVLQMIKENAPDAPDQY